VGLAGRETTGFWGFCGMDSAIITFYRFVCKLVNGIIQNGINSNDKQFQRNF
jgi:hypothetical protein